MASPVFCTYNFSLSLPLLLFIRRYIFPLGRTTILFAVRLNSATRRANRIQAEAVMHIIKHITDDDGGKRICQRIHTHTHTHRCRLNLSPNKKFTLCKIYKSIFVFTNVQLILILLSFIPGRQKLTEPLFIPIILRPCLRLNNPWRLMKL